MKRTIVCTLLVLALLLGSVTADAQEQEQAKPAWERLLQLFGGGDKEGDSAPSSVYALGADELASIPAVVGPRECTEARGAGSEEQEYAYASDSVRNDLLAYIDYLGERGFEIVRGAPLGEPGEGELSAASKDAGRMIIMRLDWTLDSYRIRIVKSGEEGGQSAVPGEASELKNYEDWIRPYVDVMPFQPSILDSFIHSIEFGDGWVEEAVAYPSEWPAQWQDGVIPAYTGTGWMFDAFVVHPRMSYDAKHVWHMSVTVYDYLPEEVDAYIDGLKASGFVEMEASQYDAHWMDSAREFRGEGCTLNIVFAHGEGADFKILSAAEDPEAPQPFVQFIVDFNREPYAPDLGLTDGTELMNYNQFSDYMGGTPAERRSELDVLADSFADEYGRLYETVYYPSKWPKDVFGVLIPEYRSPGMMYFMEITTPADNPDRDQTLIASMYIAPRSEADIEQYARELAAFGYRELTEEEYSAHRVSPADEHEVFHAFALPSMHCIVATYDDDGMKMLQITLRFDGRYNNFFGQ